jgi:hypothetical protein
MALASTVWLIATWIVFEASSDMTLISVKFLMA